MNCPHCGTCLDAPEEGCMRWGLMFGHPFTSHMEIRLGDTGRYMCRECNGEWTGDLRQQKEPQQ